MNDKKRRNSSSSSHVKGKKCIRAARKESTQPVANRNYKDTVFRMLFSDKRNLLELYNAVTGRDYDNPDELEIVTLENAVYMGMKNDLAFVFDTGIYLYEHQSLVNPNIPLRDLFYISAEYSRLVEKQSLYSSAVRKIPTPSFMVFYNGSAKQEDSIEYKLSDAYISKVEEPSLELKVTVLNVNEGHNEELMRHCTTLREYAQYVAKVRRYTVDMGLNAAVKQAIDECIAEGILEDFLRKNRPEVEMTSIFEYNKEEEEKKLRKAEYELGVEDGTRTGIEIGTKSGIEIGTRNGSVLRLIDMTIKKIKKGCSVSQTADMLEESQDNISRIYDIAASMAPDYDVRKICEEYQKKADGTTA